MIRNILTTAAIAAALLAASACSTTPPPPPPEASLSFSGIAGCTEAFSAADAQALTVKKRQSSGSAVSILNAGSACQSVGDSQRPYALFKLPAGVKISTIQAGSTLQAKRVFAAEVVTLDENLVPVRTFGPETFLHRGASLSAFFQARENERYVAIRANPELIGKHYSFTLPIEETGADPATRPGRHVDYSYEGPVFARVFLATPAQNGPKEQ